MNFESRWVGADCREVACLGGGRESALACGADFGGQRFVLRLTGC